MADFYDRIQKKKEEPASKRKRSRPVVALLLTGVTLAVAIVAAIVIWFCGVRGRFYRFVGDLSAATAWTYRTGQFVADIQGEEVIVTGDNAYGLFTYLAASGQGAELLFTPKGEPVATLTYADGSTLRIWKDDKRGEAAMRFDGPNAHKYIYSCHNKGIFPETLIVRYLGTSANRPKG